MRTARLSATKSLDGYLAVGVPGTVHGPGNGARIRHSAARGIDRTGNQLADEGFVLTRGDVDVLSKAPESFGCAQRGCNILNQGEAFAPGDRFAQKDLATTLRAISAGGPMPSTTAPYPRRSAPLRAPTEVCSRPGFCGLYHDGVGAHHLLVSRLYDRFRAAAEFRRHHSVRNAASAAGLPAQGNGISFQQRGSRHDRGDAPCLSRPQYLSGRSGVYRQSDPRLLSAQYAESIRAQTQPTHHALPRLCRGSQLRKSMPPRRTIPWPMGWATQSHSPTPSMILSAPK